MTCPMCSCPTDTGFKCPRCGYEPIKTVVQKVVERRVVLTINGKSLGDLVANIIGYPKDQLILDMIKVLKDEGYSVVKDGEWESPREICDRLGISLGGTFNRRIKNMPLSASFNVDIIKGPSGRVLFIQSNLFFDEYLRKGVSNMACKGGKCAPKGGKGKGGGKKC